MFWVYFVRDFYRAGAAAPTASSASRRVKSATAQHGSAQSFTLALPNETPYAIRMAEPTAAPQWGDTNFAPAACPVAASPVDAAMDDPEMLQVQEDVLLLSRKMQKLQAALAVSDRGRSTFLSSMSHELRTPLNAIMGFSDMMKSGVFGPIDNPTYAQYVTHIHDSGATLLAKINDLLDIASMDADHLTLEEAECDVGEILEELVEIHSHTAFARQQTIYLDAPDTITLHADRNKLLCVLSHFVSNALRHSKDDAVVTVMARVQAEDG